MCYNEVKLYNLQESNCQMNDIREYFFQADMEDALAEACRKAELLFTLKQTTRMYSQPGGRQRCFCSSTKWLWKDDHLWPYSPAWRKECDCSCYFAADFSDKDQGLVTQSHLKLKIILRPT